MNFIGVFDSGAGGLNVLKELKKIMPNESYIYLADNANMPYGNKSQDAIIAAALNNCKNLAQRGLKALVVACNTATMTTVSTLRQEYPFVVVGIEPAIKPASFAFSNEKIVLLCSQATARQQKFVELVFKYKSSKTLILPQNNLASEIEDNLFSLEKLEKTVEGIFSPHLDAAAVVLGCTHYDFIAPIISSFYAKNSKKVAIFSGNKGVAHNLKNQLAAQTLLNKQQEEGQIEFIATNPLGIDKYRRYFESMLN